MLYLQLTWQKECEIWDRDLISAWVLTFLLLVCFQYKPLNNALESN